MDDPARLPDAVAGADDPAEEPVAAPPSRLGRTRLRIAGLKKRGEELAERAEAEREQHASVDVTFDVVDRDGEVGGGLIAGALAYRFFIWLLPVALVAVALLGVAADAAEESPGSAARYVGLADFVTSSVAGASRSSTRWYALLIGVPALLIATRSVLRALVGAHRLIWADARKAAPKATPTATLVLLGYLMALFAVSVLASAIRARSDVLGVLSSVVIAVPYTVVWVLVSLRLPHRGAHWTALVPGALVVAGGFELLYALASYFLAPYAAGKAGTYGALGVAAALLLTLFLLCRLIVVGALLNASLHERRSRAD